MTVAGVLLAGGAGSRFSGDEHKLLVRFRGRPLAAWAVGAAANAVADGALDAAYLVTGAVGLRPALLSALEHSRDLDEDWHRGDLDDIALARKLGISLLANDRWSEGQATSLAVGITQAAIDGHQAVVVGLADQPFVDAAAWTAVAEAEGPIVTATFDGRRRPPVKLAAEVWPLLSGTGDEGARSLLRMRPDLVSEVPCKGNPTDIDTLEDLEKWS